MSKVVTCCPCNNENGVYAHLKPLEKIINSKHYDLTEKNQLLKESPDLIIFAGCWVKEYEEIAVELKKKGSKISIVFCSSIGQMDLCNETQAFQRAVEHLNSGFCDYLFLGSRRMKALYKNNEKIKWFPTTFNYEEFNPCFEKDNNSISLWANPAPQKNILNQLAAVSLQSNDIVLYTSSELSKKYEWVLKEWKVKYVSPKDWLKKEDYFKYIGQTALGLHVNYSESFARVISDHMIKATPVITNALWLKNYEKKYPSYVENMFVENSDDVFMISNKIHGFFSKSKEEQDELGKIATRIVKSEFDFRKKYVKRMVNEL